MIGELAHTNASLGGARKLRENVEPLFGIARADEIIRCVRALPQAATLATLAALTRLPDAAVIDGAPAA